MPGQYQLPPWIGQPARPGEALSRGVQTGSMLKRNFMLARQQAEESAREQAMMPLKMQALNNQIKATALDLEVGGIKQQEMILNKQAFSELSRAAMEISQNAAWAKPESEARVWGIAAKYPSVVKTPEFRDMTKQFDVANVAAIKERAAEIRATGLQNELTLGTERNAIAAEKNALLEEKYKAELSSKEKLATENNENKIKLATMKLDRDAKEILPEMYYRKFSEMAKAISSEEGITLDAKERKMNATFERIKSEWQQSKGQTAAGMVEMTGPDGKRYHVPAANVEKARAKGYK